eukprot:6172037-Pleurochrysis_carterae.AAC.2
MECKERSDRFLRVAAITMAPTTQLKLGDKAAVPVSVFGHLQYVRARKGRYFTLLACLHVMTEGKVMRKSRKE